MQSLYETLKDQTSSPPWLLHFFLLAVAKLTEQCCHNLSRLLVTLIESRSKSKVLRNEWTQNMTSGNYQFLAASLFGLIFLNFETHLFLLSSLSSALSPLATITPSNAAYFEANVTAGTGDSYGIQQPIHYDALCWNWWRVSVASSRHFTSFLILDTH